ncbi:hypothetical protein P7C71_g2930, partial [Lecanoromycetidae sp. Uapishka_2]
MPQAATVTGDGALPALPSASTLSSPIPLSNAAIWQEAVELDTTIDIGQNYVAERFYQLVAYAQSMENTSNNNIYGDPIIGASYTSQGLQALNMYPTQFDQPQAAYPATTKITISSSPEQTIKYFGASGAWWPNDLQYFPSAQQQNLSKLLFSKDWLYLSGYRYNMGATGDKDNITVTQQGRGVESFMKTDGTYDWTRDGPGIYYLRAAMAANVSSIAFFVNAQPSAMSSDPNSTYPFWAPCGSTLAPGGIPQFVKYIETVLAYWAGQGVTIDYISPMNEPDSTFWDKATSSCPQEGMAVTPSDRPSVFQALRAALTTSTSTAVKAINIMGDETSQIASMAIPEYSQWLPQTLQEKWIDAISVHMYDFPDDATLLNYKQLIVNASLPNAPPPIKMTEISSFASASGVHKPWGWTGPKIMTAQYDPSIDSALDMARMIWQWLTLVGAESFDWWTAVSHGMGCVGSPGTSCTDPNNSNGWNDALIYIDPNYATNENYNFYLTKRFWVYKHFTTFIRPGSVKYDIPNAILPYGTVAVASLDTTGIWNTIFINRNASAQAITMELPSSGGKILAMTETTDVSDWAVMPLPDVGSDNAVMMSLPARGVLSMQFSVAGPISSRQVDLHDEWIERDEGHERRSG